MCIDCYYFSLGLNNSPNCHKCLECNENMVCFNCHYDDPYKQISDGYKYCFKCTHDLVKLIEIKQTLKKDYDDLCLRIDNETIKLDDDNEQNIHDYNSLLHRSKFCIDCNNGLSCIYIDKLDEC